MHMDFWPPINNMYCISILTLCAYFELHKVENIFLSLTAKLVLAK